MIIITRSQLLKYEHLLTKKRTNLKLASRKCECYIILYYLLRRRKISK